MFWRIFEAPDWGLHFNPNLDMITGLDTPMIRILDLCLNFEGAKNIHVHLVLIWGFGGRWRFLIGVWHLDLDLDMVSGL